MDDGIKYQWGDRYIEADKVIDGVGGKYWRDNSDGTITEFTPPELEFKHVKSVVEAILEFEYKVEDNVLVFETEKQAMLATAEFNSLYWGRREVSAERMANKVQIYLPKEVYENTYTPATSD